ncbi:MAG: ABC transporter ATP-binding protein [Nitriliruptorales bacterium]|nr:ABC transporter ATP-binding protein [Nitriliruptorales bacterium]
MSQTQTAAEVPGQTGDPVLSVRDLQVRFGTRRGAAHVVNGLNYDLYPGETLGIVGESGSGKSVSTLALMGLVPEPPGRVEGRVELDGVNLLDNSKDEWRNVRGNDIAMIFQDPMTSLNPVLPIGRQVTEHMRLHLGMSESEANDRAVELLERVGLSDARRRLGSYPHQLSGGMRQRVMIAIGLACNPKVLIADEATTALDVTIQAQIVELVGDLQDEFGMGVIWISHDLGVVAGIADRVMVMYAGQVVEEAPVDELYDNPSHPYTLGLLGSLPVLGKEERGDLVAIPGLPPDPVDLPQGCSFRPRCPYQLDERCETERPELRRVVPGHRAACFYEVPEQEQPEDAFDG